MGIDVTKIALTSPHRILAAPRPLDVLPLIHVGLDIKPSQHSEGAALRQPRHTDPETLRDANTFTQAISMHAKPAAIRPAFPGSSQTKDSRAP